MKRMSFLLLAALAVLQTFGQTAPAPKIRITGTRLVYPLIREWIRRYSLLHPGVEIELNKAIAADSADIVIVSHSLRPGDIKPGKTSIVLNRYLQLPVVNSRRSDVAVLQSRGFTDAAIRKVYFGSNDPANGLSAQPQALPGINNFAVYKREKPACASIAFANHYGSEQRDIKGTGINGDDQDLLEAVKKDTNGISYNNLGFLYNLKTRKVLDSIAIIPIDLNGNGRIDPEENFYGNLDQVIAFAEKTNDPKLPVEYVHVIFSKQGAGPGVDAFLDWILKDGQQYNHAYGFLDLDNKTIGEQNAILAATAVR